MLNFIHQSDGTGDIDMLQFEVDGRHMQLRQAYREGLMKCTLVDIVCHISCYIVDFNYNMQ